jgi:hypothetical protein
MSHRPCDSTEDAEMACCSRVGRLGPKPGQPTRELAQPVPYPGGVPGDLGFNERAACGVLSFFAGLGSLHGAFICAYLEISNLT